VKRENNLLCLTVCFLVLLPAISWACSGKVVEVEPDDIDRYNRLVALVAVF
jgi:hypothetical protein